MRLAPAEHEQVQHQHDQNEGYKDGPHPGFADGDNRIHIKVLAYSSKNDAAQRIECPKITVTGHSNDGGHAATGAPAFVQLAPLRE